MNHEHDRDYMFLSDSEEHDDADCIFLSDSEENNEIDEENNEIDICFLTDSDEENENSSHDSKSSFEEHCCRKMCFNQLSRVDTENALGEYPSNSTEQINWIIQSLSKFSCKQMYIKDGKVVEELKTTFLVAGKNVCETCWRKLYGISPYRYEIAKRKFIGGDTSYVHGNTAKFKLHNASSECIGWLLNYLKLIGEHLPTEDKIELPAGMTKKDVFLKMDQEIKAPPDKTKYRLWTKFCSNVITTKGNGFSKCHYCISLLTALQKAKLEKDAAKIKLIQEKRIEHWNDIRDERLEYYCRRDESRQDPQGSICIIFDAMDQCKTSFPILRRRVSKEITSRSLPPIKTYLTGALVHREGINSYKKVGYCLLDLSQFKHDVNLNITVLMEVLKDFKDSLGKTLNLQMDSASNNKNAYMIAFGGVLVHRKIFKEAYLHMLPVGHTHEDVDAMFHSIAEVLKVDVITFKDLLEQIKKVAFIKEARNIRTIWNMKTWLEPCMAGSHGFNDCFHIHIHENKGKIVWHYKKWTRCKWLPDREDESTFMSENDKDGIEIFKQAPPEGNPGIVLPTWTDEVLKQIQHTGKKLIASGLLTEEEKEWWNDTDIHKFNSQIDEVPDFPLNALKPLNEGEHAELSDELVHLRNQQERVNVVYSGKYIPPSKRQKISERISEDIPMTSDQCYAQTVPVTTKSGRKATQFEYLKT